MACMSRCAVLTVAWGVVGCSDDEVESPHAGSTSSGDLLTTWSTVGHSSSSEDTGWTSSGSLETSPVLSTSATSTQAVTAGLSGTTAEVTTTGSSDATTDDASVDS